MCGVCVYILKRNVNTLYAITDNEKRGHEYEVEWRGMCEQV